MTRRSLPVLRRLGVAVAALLCLLVAADSARPVQAQEPPPIADIRDLSLSFKHTTFVNGTINAIVWNHSTAPMRDVQVQFTTDPPVPIDVNQRPGFAPPEQLDPATNRWTIPEVRVGHVSTLQFSLVRGTYPSPIVAIRAAIIHSIPAEGAAYRDNNQAVEWLYVYSISRAKRVHPNAALVLGVDGRSPEPGHQPVFTVTALEQNHGFTTEFTNAQRDVVVRVVLSEGLAFAATPGAPSGTTFSRTSATSGVWRLGRGEWTAGVLRVPARLTTDTSAAPPLNRRCLTAQIVAGTPPPTLENGGVQTVCLGAVVSAIAGGTGTRVQISSNFCEADEERLHGVCRADETYATAPLWAHALNVEGEARTVGRYRLDGSMTIVVDPEPVTPPVTIGGTTYPWATGHVIDNVEDDDRFPGVRIVRGIVHHSWAENRRVSIADVTPKQRPGAIAELYRWDNGTDIQFWEGLNPDKSDKLVDTGVENNQGISLWSRLVVFGAPGVYTVKIGYEHTWKGAASFAPGSAAGVSYATSGIITYVVGDVADLQVHDAGGHGTLPRGQQAYILRAENLLDTTAEQVQVALTGVPRGARADLSADGGAYAPGACDANGLCTGTWTIGALESRDHRYASGRSDGPTLTLLVDGDPAPLTATITSTRTRTVTTGGKTYTISVTDVNDANSKNVRVPVGTGRGEPDPEAPQDVRVERLGATALVRWEPVATVSQWPVAYYEVERNRQLLAVRPAAPLYLDLQAGGNPVYRVRAVSEAGVRGPWKISAAGLLPPPVPIGLTAVLITDQDVQLTWAAPDAGDTITGYTIQVADHAGGPWSTLARLNGDARHWIHPNLPATGATKYYRIRAHNRSQPGEWTTASVELKTSETATGFRAQRFTTRHGNHGIQVWLGPYACAVDATDCLALIEFRQAGSSAWWFGSEEYSDIGVVPWDPDASYFTQGSGRSAAVRLDAAYDIRVCQLTEAQLEAKHAEGKPEGTWCVGHTTGQLRVPAGE